MSRAILLENGEGQVLPITVSDLVYDNETGKSVKEDLDYIKNRQEEIAEEIGIDNKDFYPVDKFNEEYIRYDYAVKGNNTSIDLVTSTTVEDATYIAPLEKNATYLLIYANGTGSGYSYTGLVFLDSNLNKVSTGIHTFGSNAVNQKRVLTIPQNATYFALVYNSKEIKTTELHIFYDIPLSEYYMSNGILTPQLTETLQFYIANSGKERKVVNGNVLSIHNAVDVIIDGSRFVVHKIPVDGKRTILLGGFRGYISKTLLEAYNDYDEKIYSKQLYGGGNDISFGGNTWNGNNEFYRSCLVPEETKYIKVYSVAEDVNVKKSYEEFISNRYVNIDYHYKNDDKKPNSLLFEKKIACFGDSITDFGSSASDSYAWKLFNNHQCQVRNYGRGSSHFIDYAGTDFNYNVNPGAASGDNKNVVTTQIRWMQNEGFVPDIAIVNGCTNDAFSTVRMGDIDEEISKYSTENSLKLNFYAVCVYIVAKLREINPNMQIYFATPIRSLNLESSSHMINLRQYVEGFKIAAKKLGVHLIDWCDESGIIQYPTDLDSNVFFTDSLHPSNIGTDLMYDLVIKNIGWQK